MKRNLTHLTPHGMWWMRTLNVLCLILCVLVAHEARAQQTPPVPTPPKEIVAPKAPDIHAVHHAALSHYGLVDDTNARKIKRRIRRANLLPDLEVRSMWRHQDDEETDYREDLDFDDLGLAIQDSARHDSTTGTTDQDTYSIALKFRLSRVVFDPQELDVDRAQSQRIQRRERLLTLVNDRYYERAHYQARQLTLELDDEERLLHQAHIARCEADLDALTGGWFTQHMEGQTHAK